MPVHVLQINRSCKLPVSYPSVCCFLEITGNPSSIYFERFRAVDGHSAICQEFEDLMVLLFNILFVHLDPLLDRKFGAQFSDQLIRDVVEVFKPNTALSHI